MYHVFFYHVCPTARNFWKAAGMSSKVEDVMKGFSCPEKIAEFGIQLMFKGKSSGIPGWKNKSKFVIKKLLPGGIWSYVIKKHMIHPSLKRNDR
jgi:short-subunit dehydrogenase